MPTSRGGGLSPSPNPPRTAPLGGLQAPRPQHADLGEEDGVINFLEGAYLNMTFTINGEQVTQNRTFGHIRVLQERGLVVGQ